jgi:hypothetical protein
MSTRHRQTSQRHHQWLAKRARGASVTDDVATSRSPPSIQ